jgi:oligopeptide/dipeptide ABC transporter ATP-binding protein
MLDISVRAGVLNLLSELRAAGMGILMITHDLSTAAQYADRICVMYLGRIVEEGPAREVVLHPRHPYTRALVSVVPSPVPGERRVGSVLQGEPPDPAAVPPGCRFHPRCPIAVEACRETDPPLLAVGESQEGQRAACIRLDQTVREPSPS